MIPISRSKCSSTTDGIAESVPLYTVWKIILNECRASGYYRQHIKLMGLSSASSSRV